MHSAMQITFPFRSVLEDRADATQPLHFVVVWHAWRMRLRPRSMASDFERGGEVAGVAGEWSGCRWPGWVWRKDGGGVGLGKGDDLGWDFR